MGKLSSAIFCHDREIAELRADSELAVEYLRAAVKSLDDFDDRAADLLALRTVTGQANISCDAAVPGVVITGQSDADDIAGCFANA